MQMSDKQLMSNSTRTGGGRVHCTRMASQSQAQSPSDPKMAAPGELQHPQTFPFNFKNVEKQYESYNGINVRLRYFVRVTVSRRMADVIREKDIWVYSYRIPPETNSSIKMDVGIEDCLHIEFEYSKSKYHLKDVIVGRIYFLLVRLKIKHMELSIIRRETTGVAPTQYNESETLVRFEVCPRTGCMMRLRYSFGNRLWTDRRQEVCPATLLVPSPLQ